MVFKKASSIVGMNYSLFEIFEFEYINYIIRHLIIKVALLFFLLTGIANYFELRALGKKIIIIQLGMNHTFEV